VRDGSAARTDRESGVGLGVATLARNASRVTLNLPAATPRSCTMSASPTPAPATGAPESPAPRKKGKKLVLAVVCLFFTGAGAAFPMLVPVSSMFAKSKEDKGKEKKDAKTAIVPFGDVVVNLSEDRLQRYLRVKVAILAEADAEKEVTDLITKKKAAVKSAMIAHLAGKSLKDVSGSVGVTRTQRELLERIEDVLYPDGNSRIKAVLFEEYVVQ
jgi:flagellar FliL protein